MQCSPVKKIIAQVAPAFVGQFGKNVTPDAFKTALKQLGFYDVYETAIGADLGAMTEAEHYVKEVATGRTAIPSDKLLPVLVNAC